MVDITDVIDLYIKESSNEELKLGIARLIMELNLRGESIKID
jgi:hypothetical protein